MEVEETKTKCSSSRYGKPPWIFKGSALYQFHLVKAEIARSIIPKDLRLVEAFGYTLGGFFLANYNESPFGSFDELVVMAGIVWNPPTSHAWAARVYVNSHAACTHGRKEFGLPSQVATFSKSIKAVSMNPNPNNHGFFTTTNIGYPYTSMDIRVAEINGPMATRLYDIALPSPVFKMNPFKWMGPTIKLSLPSFSGHTEHTQQLLKYYCDIKCRVKPTSPASIVRVSEDKPSYESENLEERDLSISVMLSKPILALEFKCLTMQVEPPVVVSTSSS